MAQTNVAAGSFAKWLAQNFHGWHFATTQAPQTTGLAVIPVHKQSESSVVKAIQAISDRKDVFCVTDVDDAGRATGGHNRFVKMMYNNGLTLQSRVDVMNLTRPVRVLVKGSSASHVATVCILNGYTMFTDAFFVAESTAVQELIKEAQRLVRDPCKKSSRDTLSRLTPPAKRPASETPAMAALRKEPTIQTLLEKVNCQVPPEMCVLMVQATAVMISGYQDAGSKFRDRSARFEANRHQEEAIRAILAAPYSRDAINC